VTAPEVVGIPNGSFAENTWLVTDPATRDTAVVDPGEEHGRILAAIRHRDLVVRDIWLTHAHVDHIWGVDAVRAATGAVVRLHPGDRAWFDRFAVQCEHFGFTAQAPLAPPDRELAHGEELAVGNFRFAVRHVPGHSPGHVAFIGHGLCLSGDVLFQGSIGRTDLPGGDYGQLLASIHGELLVLPDATRVLTGHGPETTIGSERRSNPFLQQP
jgi:glyoxylase-like metal-dependent hydrolase (beta-lactamase superfamily II)